jgi:hypothetical protein
MTGLAYRSRLAAVLAISLVAAPEGFAQGAGEPFTDLPRQEIRGSQIGWYVNDTLSAMTAAVESNKALIMVFGDKSSSFTAIMSARVAPCPHLNQLAGAAVFAFGSPNVDEFARRMAVHLKLTEYPTISVIEPRTDMLAELYRMEGFFDAESIGADLQSALTKSNLWPTDMARPGRLPQHALAYPGMACTVEGAKRLGIVPTAPSPRRNP